MYTRVKKIKGREYAYRIRNIWTNKGPRQKTVGYIGKIVRILPEKKCDFNSYLADEKINLDELSYKQLINELVRFELVNAGFEKDNSVLRKGDVYVDLANKKIASKNKNVVLALNDGFLCEMTLKTLLGFVPQGDYDEEIGLELANLLVNSGLNVSNEYFVALYEKIMQK